MLPGPDYTAGLGHAGGAANVQAALLLQQQHRQALANQYAQHQINRAMAAGLIPAGQGITGDPAAHWRQLSAQLFANNPSNLARFLGHPVAPPVAANTVPVAPPQQTIASNPALANLFSQ